MRKLISNLTSVGALLAILTFTGCKDEKKPKQSGTADTQPTEQPKLKAAPVFNEDSAYAFVKKQVDFGPRVPNTAAHVKCGNYIVAKLKEFGAEVTVQPFEAKAFTGTMLRGRNIIASYNPQATKRIIFSSHWDTRPFADQDSERRNEPIDGANDGASGVGTLLEIARQMHTSPNKPGVGIDLIFFDLEDYGDTEDFNNGIEERPGQWWCLGSQHWAANPHKSGYTAYYGVLLDMAGGPGAKFAREGVSMQHAPSIVGKIWSMGTQLGYGAFFKFEDVEGITDDHVYVNTVAKIPMVDIIEYAPEDGAFFNNNWHTHRDDMRNIDKRTLKAVGQTLMQLAAEE